jgi:hypothetical protein
MHACTCEIMAASLTKSRGFLFLRAYLFGGNFAFFAGNFLRRTLHTKKIACKKISRCDWNHVAVACVDSSM